MPNNLSAIQALLERDPTLLAILSSAPTMPSAAALGTHKGSTTDAIASLGSWLGMAIPGRGGLGFVRFPFRPSVTEHMREVRPGLDDLAREMAYSGGALPNPGEVRPMPIGAMSIGPYRGADISKGIPALQETVDPSVIRRLFDALSRSYKL